MIHLATGLLVGYPPCQRIDFFKNFIEERYNMDVVAGTHPIPEKYYQIHQALGTWQSPSWQRLIEPTITDEATRKEYD